MKRNQSGFGAVEGLLIVVIVVLLGFVGYTVYMHHSKTPTNITATTTTIPVGFTQYKDTDLGISFAYPKEWGTPSFKTLKAYASNGSMTPLSGVVGGYYGTFSGSSAFTTRAISKSNVHQPYGEADPYLGSGFCVQGAQITLEDSNLTPLPAQSGVVDYKNSGAKCSRAVTLVQTVKANTSYIVKISCQQGCTDYLIAISNIKTVQNNISAIAFTSTDTTQNSVLAQVLSTITQL